MLLHVCLGIAAVGDRFPIAGRVLQQLGEIAHARPRSHRRETPHAAASPPRRCTPRYRRRRARHPALIGLDAEQVEAGRPSGCAPCACPSRSPRPPAPAPPSGLTPSAWAALSDRRQHQFHEFARALRHSSAAAPAAPPAAAERGIGVAAVRPPPPAAAAFDSWRVEQRAQAQVLALTQGQRNLLVEHVLIHAHFVAVGLAQLGARVAHALQHHLQEQRLHLLRRPRGWPAARWVAPSAPTAR